MEIRGQLDRIGLSLHLVCPRDQTQVVNVRDRLLSCVLAGVTSPMGCHGQLQVCLVQCPVVSILHLFLVIIIFELMFCEGMVSEPQNQEGKGTQSSFCHVS